MRKALVIGISSYNYPLAPLQGSLPDAKEIAARLRNDEDGTLNFHVKEVLNPATAGELKKEIKDFFAVKNEVSLLYYAGHGTKDDVGGYLVTPDYTSEDPGLSMIEVLRLVNKSPATNKIVILDCCNSGHFGSGSSLSDATEISTGMVVLTSTTDNDIAKETKGHGTFTNLLLSALDGGAADLNGNITPGSVYAYIDQAMNVWGQRPVFKTNVIGFVHLRKTKRHVRLDVMKRLLEYFPDPYKQFKLDPSYEDTNSPDVEHSLKPPYADQTNVKTFKELQELQKVGLVEPVDESYMYFAAMNSKSCRLTALGQHYWQRVKEGKY